MKAKKRLVLITLIISILSLVIAVIIGKESNSIYYDISMALLGSAVLGFIMSITEYYVERKNAMENFYLQATKVLKKLRKIKYFEVDAPIELIIKAFNEEHKNKLIKTYPLLYNNKKIHHKAKKNLIEWYENNIPLNFNETDNINKKLNTFYKLKMKEYKKAFAKCIESYQIASSIESDKIDNAYGNLDFLLANQCIRIKAYNNIYNKIKNIIFQFKVESYHFNLLKNRQGNLLVCIEKVHKLNNEYFSSKVQIIDGYKNKIIYQDIFDDIDEALEEFRCKIYRIKYIKKDKTPYSGEMIYFEKK